MKVVYVDTSAALKQVRRGTETDAYIAFLDAERLSGAQLVSSQLIEVELARFAVRENLDHGTRIDPVLEQHARVAINGDIVRRAVEIPLHVRSLGALHLATALHLGSSLRALATYDQQLASVARRLGLTVVSPSA